MSTWGIAVGAALIGAVVGGVIVPLFLASAIAEVKAAQVRAKADLQNVHNKIGAVKSELLSKIGKQ